MSLSVCLLTNDNNSSIQFYPSSPLLLLFALVYSIYLLNGSAPSTLPPLSTVPIPCNEFNEYSVLENVCMWQDFLLVKSACY